MRIAVLLAAALLAACATVTQEGLDALNRGDTARAEALFTDAARQGDPYAINNLGVIHQRRGNREQAISYYTLAARYGLPLAQQNLAALGAPVPAADLAAVRAQQRAANAADTASTLMLMQALQPRPAPLPHTIQCNSYRFGNSVQTDCR